MNILLAWLIVSVVCTGLVLLCIRFAPRWDDVPDDEFDEAVQRYWRHDRGESDDSGEGTPLGGPKADRRQERRSRPDVSNTSAGGGSSHQRLSAASFLSLPPSSKGTGIH
jgi:hypothetical protein